MEGVRERGREGGRERGSKGKIERKRGHANLITGFWSK